RRRAGAGREPLQAAASPVHVGTAGLAAAPRHQRRPVDADPGHAAVAAQPAEGLPLPSALPVRDGDLQGEGAGAAAGLARPGAFPALPSRRGDEGPRGGEAHTPRAGGVTSTEAQTETAARQPAGDELLVVENLKKHFPVTRGII